MSTTHSALTTTAGGVCELKLLDVRAHPFPHVLSEGFIEPSHYERLRRTFPVCPRGTSPTGFSLYSGDGGYERLLEEEPAWRALFETFHSQAFVDWGIGQFASVWGRGGCRVDLSKARYVAYREDRVDKERPRLRRVDHAPEELWVRMDIHQGRVGYSRPVHLDHARRLVSMLIYFCDHAENRMTGGELLLHGAPTPGAPPPARVTPRHNLMAAFPCANNSHHSVPEITSAAAPRNYVQVHISSSVDIWPRERTLRATLSSLKLSLTDALGM
ncbi:MAG TPA: 2OG-Fe(II) oxygenase [Pyrinomonadaceae bacterium]|jgi:hypothetical protein|nr:2OG-Fe(II) oxygenase [Pyrinomonadaceae bacterium]